MEPTIKVTRIGARWHARLMDGITVLDEMACSCRQDIGWISRTMLRWFDKTGGVSLFASAARRRTICGPVGQVWWSGDLQNSKNKNKLKKLKISSKK
jgi:hypothetical protein